MNFRGRERVTIELDGTFDPIGLVVPARVQLELVDGRARVRLFAFDVEDMRVTGMPLLELEYAEVLWRIAVRAGNEPAWWVAACDIARRRARWLASRVVRYPVRAHEVEVSSDRLRVEGGGRQLAISIGRSAAKKPLEHRLLLTGPHAGWRVPWLDDATEAHTAPVEVEADSLGIATLGAPVTWASTAFVRHDREHDCGAAEPR